MLRYEYCASCILISDLLLKSKKGNVIWRINEFLTLLIYL